MSLYHAQKPLAAAQGIYMCSACNLRVSQIASMEDNHDILKMQHLLNFHLFPFSLCYNRWGNVATCQLLHKTEKQEASVTVS